MPTVKPAPQYDVFISYRRGTADELALLLQDRLQKHGVTAFRDRDLRRGTFDDTLLRHIAESPTFLIILTPGALDRCGDEEDWLRKEIVHAISSKRNIIPLQVDSFQFTQEVVRKLDPAIRALARYQTVEYSRAYFESTVERIAKIVEEDKTERRAVQEAEADRERQRAERAEAKLKEQEKPAGSGQLEAGLAAKQAEVTERGPIASTNAKPPGHERRNLGQWLRPRKRVWWASTVAVLAGLILVGLKFFSSSVSLPSKPGGSETLTTSVTSGKIAIGTVKINSKDGLKYVWIPPGNFQMGCSAGDTECYDDEKPAHSVTITKGFWMGQTPVTEAAYQRVMNAKPSRFHGEQLPVESVTWDQAKAYCEAADGRLPTEAEWEYAARAGTTSARYGDVDSIAWYEKNSGSKTHEVAQKQPNAWGLYDMLGNVWEWVGDRYDANYYKNSPSTDARGPDSGEFRTVRGGSLNVGSRDLRSSNRNRLGPGVRYSDVGFRCAREVFP